MNRTDHATTCISSHIKESFPGAVLEWEPMGQQQFKIRDSQSGTHFFVKTAPDGEPMFQSELKGLLELGKTGAIRYPRPLCTGSTKTEPSEGYIVMEYLDLQDDGDWYEMGKSIARLHAISSEDGWFGWDQNNTIGPTTQLNTWTSSWMNFFSKYRIQYQLSLASKTFSHASYIIDDVIPALLEHHHPVPALLHGDLWVGNAGFVCKEPVVFDPAVYYGDREADLAMTELFGKFPPRFYKGYESVCGIDRAGYRKRKILYNLYHSLNHYNMFGGYYAEQVDSEIQKLIDL